MPRINNRFATIGVKKRSRGERESTRIQEENSFSISINETWLSMADGHVTIKDDEMPDLRAFWKGEGNATSIREARGIYVYISRVQSFSFTP